MPSSSVPASCLSYSSCLKVRRHHTNGEHHVRCFAHTWVPRLTLITDIIALLLLGMTLIVTFVFWQRYLEQKYDTKLSKRYPPPLMRLSLWTRGDGRVAAAFIIAFLTWCALYSWLYWAQVYLLRRISMLPPLTFSDSCIIRTTWDWRL